MPLYFHVININYFCLPVLGNFSEATTKPYDALAP